MQPVSIVSLEGMQSNTCTAVQSELRGEDPATLCPRPSLQAQIVGSQPTVSQTEILDDELVLACFLLWVLLCPEYIPTMPLINAAHYALLGQGIVLVTKYQIVPAGGQSALCPPAS